MQFHQIMSKAKGIMLFFFAVVLIADSSVAQVNTVEFGKNRIQFRRFKWQYLQTTNFNTYFYDNGKPLAAFVAQIAERELPQIEQFVEYGLQRRANIIIYNTFDELQQSNIALNLDWQMTGGITKLVNNKMIVYFDGDHANLKRMVRQGIARTLVDNILFGDDLGEFAANQALLDLPKWLTDGYVDYVAEEWSPALDDQLKSAILSGDYKNFYQFAYEKPLLAGHAFWYYIAEKYKKENVTYFLYLARVYRNLNSASQRICKKKFKEVLKEFMTENEEKYYKDIRGRRNFPKGTISIVEELKHERDYIRFTPNPTPRSQTYAVVEYNKGKYSVVLYENLVDKKVLLKNGVRSNEHEVNPNYPLLAWDPKGTRLACIYWEGGKTKLFVYDLVKKYKPIKQDLTHFEQVQDMKFMLNSNTLLLSAVRRGQPDIFVYTIDKDSYEQVTNDSYADLDATFVSFPNKSGIIFSSNRPNATVREGDTALPSDHYNIFLADNFNKSEFRQITQLTKMKYGSARYPAPYNTTHFTFVSDENGVTNRYAGFFTTRRAGVDTIYVVGDEYLRNPDDLELDSTLKNWGRQRPDSIFSFAITNDSAYVFPITNYQSGLLETKVAGDNGQVSEVRQEGNLKFLYKLKVDENALRRRNVNPKPTEYMKKVIAAQEAATGKALQFKQNQVPAQPTDTSKPADTTKKSNAFESEFDKDSSNVSSLTDQGSQLPGEESILKKAKIFDYRLKFSVDNFSGSFNNDVLVNRFQPYTGSLPVVLQSGGGFNGMLKASVFDLFEDLRFTGAIRLPLISGIGSGASVGTSGASVFVPVNQSLFDGGGEWFARFDYLPRRMDYSLVYYRRTQIGLVTGINGTTEPYEGKMYTNLFQGIMRYPLDRNRSIRFTAGIRTDRVVVRADLFNDTASLKAPDRNKQVFAVTRLEWVYDNTVQKAMNIMNGLRYKIYVDLNSQINTPQTENTSIKPGRYSFNSGVDARYYFPIFRNFIWAGRAAADFSWGNQKILYYLGGVDGWMFPKFNIEPRPQGNEYAFQSLAVNLRGFNQNVSNGNNAVILNSEFRLPVFSTLFNKPINNAFLRNFQLIQFIDLGSAWNGKYNGITRPEVVYPSSGGATVVRIKAGGVGPFVGGYGFGVRSTVLGYFLRLDAGWQMGGFFNGKPILHFAMGVDF
jgi:hypothetical protein